MKKIKMIMLVVVIITMAISMVGCGTKKSPSGNQQTCKQIALAIVAGVHSNSMKLPLNSSSIRTSIYNTCYTYGDISIINCDGAPQVLYQTKIQKPAVDGLSPEKMDSIATEYTVQLQQVLSETTAYVSEVNTLKAIEKAAQALCGADEDTTDKTLLILDSGLSTIGYLDFTQKGLLSADADNVVRALTELSAIPDLKDVNVVWSFCGEVAAPQKELTNREKENLKDIWKSVLEAGGARNVEFSNDFITNTPVSGLPSVTAVEVGQPEINIELPEEEPEQVIIPKPIETVIIDEESVSFVGDESSFVDVERATLAIRRVAEQLLNNPDNKIYVVGTTASGDEEFCKKLSYERAEAVKKVLVECGVSEEQLITVGLGCTSPWHEEDTYSGVLIEEKAKQNRKVILIDVNSKDAKLLN